MHYSDKHLRKILKRVKSIAIVGVSANEVRPSYFVARYLSLKGYALHPINPGHAGRRLFGAEVYGSLADLAKSVERVDMVDIFRRSEDVGPIVDDAIEHFLDKGLSTIWMQIGVENETAAKRAEAAGLDVVMNRCPKIEYQRLVGELSMGGFNSGRLSSRLR